jgi:phosphoribosylformylglycinamidine synthase I
MTPAIVVFPGSNRERDIAEAFRLAGSAEPRFVWHGDSDIPAGTDLIVVPGGFAYGDYLRTGAIAAHSPIMGAIKREASRGVRVLGVCNGFQILTEAGLLPGVLLRNASLKFICRDVTLKVETSNSPFTRGYNAGQVLRVPVAHHDGNYFADADMLKSLEDQDRIAFRYAAPNGAIDDAHNPNGSILSIAGILSESRTVLGMMPHPENATDPLLGSTDGLGLFKSLVEGLS